MRKEGQSGGRRHRRWSGSCGLWASAVGSGLVGVLSGLARVVVVVVVAEEVLVVIGMCWGGGGQVVVTVVVEATREKIKLIR